MMVAIRKWMLLWPCLKFLETLESLNDGTPVARGVQTEKLLHDCMDPMATLPVETVRTSDEEPMEGDMSALIWSPATSDPPREMLRNDSEEVRGNRNQNENPATRGRPLSGERKAQIKHKMAINRKNFEDMKSRGEPMVNWINIILKMEKMMEAYSLGIGGESTASMLRKLKGVKIDIQRVVRARFRDWIGLGGRVFEPLQQEEASKIPENLNHGLTDNLETILKVTDDLSGDPKIVDVIESHRKVKLQPDTSSSMVSQKSNAKPDFEGRLEKVPDLMEEEATEASSKSEGKNLGDQENLTTQLTEEHIKIVYDAIMESSFNYLVHILQSVTFRSWESDAPTWKEYGEEIRVTKLTFQRSILQIIQFMCKFHLVQEGKLEKFVENNKTLDLMGDHVNDIFHVLQHRVYNRSAFIPDMEFLRNHWQTEYLHEIFEVMGKSQEAHVLSAALTAMVKLNQRFCVHHDETELSKCVYDIIIENRFFLRLEDRAQHYPQSDTQPKEETDLEESGDKLIKMFQKRIPSYQGDMGGTYYLLYHTLEYIRIYHAEYMERLFSGEENELKTFMKQLEIFRTGFKVSQIIRQGQTYREIIEFENNEIYTISKSDAGRRLVQIKKDYEDIATSYKQLHTHLKQATGINEKLENWFKGDCSTAALIMFRFYLRANSWDEGIRSEGIRRHSLRLAQKMKVKHESFPNLEPKIELGSPSNEPKTQTFPVKEILDLWDPESFYV